MGCSQNKDNPLSDRSNGNKIFSNKFEDYIESENQSYTVYFYQLLWKNRPLNCFFQLKEKEIVSKKNVSNLNQLLKQKIIISNNSKELITKEKLIIYYIHCSKGVIITRNSKKINYYLSNYIDSVIDICLVDISNINLNGGDKFNLYQVKNQSKYFFDLNMKEIDFSERNDLVSLGKKEQIFVEEVIAEDEEVEEKMQILKNSEIIVKFNKKKYVNGGLNEEKDSFFQSNNQTKEKGKKDSKEKNRRKSIKKRNSLRFKNAENEKLLLSPRKSNKKDIDVFNKKMSRNSRKSILKISENGTIKNNIFFTHEKILNKEMPLANNKNENLSKNSLNKKEEEKTVVIDKINVNNINNKNSISDILDKNSKQIGISNNNLINASPYEVKDKCLIIKENKFSSELNKELEQLLFETVYLEEDDPKDKDIYSPYDHINFSPSTEKKRKKLPKTTFRMKSSKINSKNAFLLSNNEYTVNKDKRLFNYIIIHNRYKIPFELRTSKNNITKVIFAACDFSNLDNLFYFFVFIDMLTNYKYLEQIKIYQNPDFSNSFNGWKYLGKLFSENFNIKWVSLKNGGLEDKLIEIIISSMLLKRIRYLNISNNNITNKAMYYLNKFLIKNQTLSVLYMKDNHNLTIEGIKLIINALQMHPNIIKFDVSNMNLEGSGQFFSSLLNENKSLQELNLRNTHLSKSDITFLATKLILEECSIINLDIGLNSNIGDEGLKEIGKIIINNRSLKSIGLDGLNLSMNNYLPIFEAIYKNRNIENYSLNMNSGLPLKGILNFFLKNLQVKEISIIPWDIEKDHDKTFTQDQLYAIEKFHLKAPHINIKGVVFVETEENENDVNNKEINVNK